MEADGVNPCTDGVQTMENWRPTIFQAIAQPLVEIRLCLLFRGCSIRNLPKSFHGPSTSDVGYELGDNRN